LGFLHTGATFTADLNLVVQVGMGVALLAGAQLARRRRFRAHGRCQATVMLLNLIMIFLVMVPAFRSQVSPHLQRAGSDLYYALPAVHAGLGTIAELLGLYVVLVATGAPVVPVRFRFTNYRRWMRTTLALWWVVLAFGAGTYFVWYRGEGPAASGPPAARAAAVATVTVQNFTFEPNVLTVRAGTTVTWNDVGGRHTVESADGFLKSDTLIAGETYQKRFDAPGIYDYYCGNHGTKSGTGMTGRVVVTAR
jgi:plastocyanin